MRKYEHYIGVWAKVLETWPQDYKAFLMLNSTEHEIYTAHKC